MPTLSTAIVGRGKIRIHQMSIGSPQNHVGTDYLHRMLHGCDMTDEQGPPPRTVAASSTLISVSSLASPLTT
jgi:hypothetical protein